MAVPSHFRFVVRGVFGNTPETWSTSCHFRRTWPLEDDVELDDIDESGVTGQVDAFFSTSQFQTSVYLTDWRMYKIGTDGKMVGNGPLQHDYAALTVHGGGADHKYPPQVALVASLIAVNRGPAQRGRMYLPGPNTSLGADGRLSAANALTWANEIGAFLKGVSDQIDAPVTFQTSGLNVSPGPAGSATGTFQEIDHIEVGRALDTMRTRRRSLDEDRQVAGHLDW